MPAPQTHHPSTPERPAPLSERPGLSEGPGRIVAVLVLSFAAGCAGSDEAATPTPSLDSGAPTESGPAPGLDSGPPSPGLDAALPSADAADGSAADTGTAADGADGGRADAGVTALYAAPNGSGTSCTLAAPCTLDGAVAAVRGLTAGMTGNIDVYLRGGTYRRSIPLVLGPGDSGQNGHSITYRAFPGEAPLLSGAVQVLGFAQSDPAKNIWRATLPSGAVGARGRQLFVNGVRAFRARTAGSPNGVTATASGFTTTDVPYATFGNASSIEVVQDNDWKHMRCPLQSVASLAAGGSTLNVLPNCWKGNNLSVPNLSFPLNGSGLPAMSGISWVENAYELLTQPGQFYLDPSTSSLFYIPRSGEDLVTADVELPVLETLVSLSGTPGHLAPRNEGDTAATYVGSWFAATGRGLGDLGDDVHATAAAGDSVAIGCTGTGLQILGETNSDEGAFRVYVDGVEDTSRTFTQASPARVAQQVVYAVSGLSNAPHTIKVVSGATAGQYTVIDGFVVVPDVISPVHDIAFDGIAFGYATWNLPSSTGYIDNQAGVLWDTTGASPTATRIPAAVQVHRGTNVSFTRCSFRHLGGTALDLADGTQGSSLMGSTIEDTSGGGVSIGEVDDYFQSEAALMTTGDTIADNAIAHVGVDYHDAVGIWAGYTRKVTIAHNDIGHTPYSGMSLGWGWGWASPCALQSKQGLTSCRYGTIYAGGNQITSNYIHDVMGYLYDGGPIYTNGGQGNGDGSATSVFVGNFVTAGNHTNNMLYQDEGSSYWSTHDNVTSFGGADWIGMWTPTIHDITVGPANYTDNGNTNNNGSNIAFTAPTLVTGGNWPAPALAIMTAAGLEAAFRPSKTTLDDDDQSMTYVGTWAAQGFRGYGDYEDNVHYTASNGDSVSVAFTGSGVSFVGEKSPDQGQVEVFVDGKSQGVVDTSVPAGSPRSTQQVLFSSVTLAAGNHVVNVAKRSGTYMTVDAFRVQP